ncbi:MAG: hypothetical protein Q4B70_13345, partial [Lachnospiraceae bacterium]|nr:hypothetical protein [Lachnospiraceae bacterium]
SAKVLDKDYKSYDRKVRLSKNKNIVIQPGKRMKVKFYVKGNITWYNYSDFTLRYYFKFDGKKYLGSTWDDGSSFKVGKKWYTTYWISYEDWYEEWVS